MRRKDKRPVLRIVSNNVTPAIDRFRELDAMINRGVIASKNANTSFYGDFTDSDIHRWRSLP